FTIKGLYKIYAGTSIGFGAAGIYQYGTANQICAVTKLKQCFSPIVKHVSGSNIFGMDLHFTFNSYLSSKNSFNTIWLVSSIKNFLSFSVSSQTPKFLM